MSRILISFAKYILDQKVLGYFADRGFKKEDMLATYNEVLGMERDSVLEYKNRKGSERVPYVITFHPRLRSLGSVLRRHFYLLKTNDRLRKAFADPPMVAFRRLKNMKKSPDLKFFIDDSLDYAMEIDELLKK